MDIACTYDAEAIDYLAFILFEPAAKTFVTDDDVAASIGRHGEQRVVKIGITDRGVDDFADGVRRRGAERLLPLHKSAGRRIGIASWHIAE
jgi:hypothetical protein